MKIGISFMLNHIFVAEQANEHEFPIDSKGLPGILIYFPMDVILQIIK